MMDEQQEETPIEESNEEVIPENKREPEKFGDSETEKPPQPLTDLEQSNREEIEKEKDQPSPQ